MYSSICGRFSWLGHYSRPIPINGSHVSIISSPHEYFQWLKSQIYTANHSIRLSSLYLGTGNHEQELIDTIKVALNEKPHLECHVILDYLRGNRGRPNSLTMLKPLLETFPTQFHLYMYHTPKLKGILKRIIPERFNEIIGVQHTKLNLFDDNVLMTGANLSEDYFTNRQDRYIAFLSSPDLANYLTKLHQIIAQHSFIVTANYDSKLIINSPLATPTYKPYSSKNEIKCHENSFFEALQSLIQEDSRTFTYDSKTHTDTSETHTDTTRTHTDTTRTHTDTTRTHTDTSETHTDTTRTHTDTSEAHTDTTRTHTDTDTYVFPLIQMGHYGINQDEIVTEKLLQTTSKIYLASGYFNLPHKYTNAINTSNGQCIVLASSPQCMGFYGAKGIAGYIPQLYSNLAKQFLKQTRDHDGVKYMEYHRPGWTYHCKGIWCYDEEKETLPLLTLIGSSNYGYRSLTRDLEVQVAMVTQNKSLKDALNKERNDIFKFGKQLTFNDIINSIHHRVTLWVRIVTGLFKYFV